MKKLYTWICDHQTKALILFGLAALAVGFGIGAMCIMPLLGIAFGIGVLTLLVSLLFWRIFPYTISFQGWKVSCTKREE